MQDDNIFTNDNTKWYPMNFFAGAGCGWELCRGESPRDFLSVKDIEVYLGGEIADKFTEVWNKPPGRLHWISAFPDSLLDSYYKNLELIYEVRGKIKEKIALWNKENYGSITIKLTHPRPEDLFNSSNELIKTIMMTIAMNDFNRLAEYSNKFQ